MKSKESCINFRSGMVRVGNVLIDKFYYLSDVILSDCGAEEASTARAICARGKFTELAPTLTSRGASLNTKGKVYKACVQ